MVYNFLCWTWSVIWLLSCDYSPVHSDHAAINQHLYELPKRDHVVLALMKAFMAEMRRHVFFLTAMRK